MVGAEHGRRLAAPLGRGSLGQSGAARQSRSKAGMPGLTGLLDVRGDTYSFPGPHLL